MWSAISDGHKLFLFVISWDTFDNRPSSASASRAVLMVIDKSFIVDLSFSFVRLLCIQQVARMELCGIRGKRESRHAGLHGVSSTLLALHFLIGDYLTGFRAYSSDYFNGLDGILGYHRTKWDYLKL